MITVGLKTEESKRGLKAVLRPALQLQGRAVWWMDARPGKDVHLCTGMVERSTTLEACDFNTLRPALGSWAPELEDSTRFLIEANCFVNVLDNGKIN